jgi:hypothetical protein
MPWCEPARKSATICVPQEYVFGANAVAFTNHFDFFVHSVTKELNEELFEEFNNNVSNVVNITL